ncbi:hypothetical protein PR202_ga04608 [Eleusine coracana subsp. coracana]|uniref:Transcription factor CBF/NF-Y/archaeal histone domain-containing protein n=1 Tax=Eleusine coracana subsp. coracana TaxID=191504 RepID=A0AAV5BRZ7_ELECO|nr:hypothetical protein PR202_ga04608 [Eleusine coracana subsp. coracana]
MHKAIPVNGRIHSDAKEAVSLCVSEFAAVLIQEAAQVGKEESRRIVSGDDVIAALSRLGLDDYVAPLTLMLQRYRESHGIVPRGWQAELPPPAPAAVAAGEVEIPPAAVVNVNDMLQAPEPDLTLGLALPVPRDVTELGLHEDAYKVWPGVAGPMPPPAGGDQ